MNKEHDGSLLFFIYTFSIIYIIYEYIIDFYIQIINKNLYNKFIFLT